MSPTRRTIDLAVALEATRVAGAAFADLPLGGSVRGRTRQLNLLPMLVDAIDNASGEADLDFTVAGRVGAPLLAGEARVADGSLDFYQTNLRLRALDATPPPRRTPSSRSTPRARPATGHSGSTDASAGATAG